MKHLHTHSIWILIFSSCCFVTTCYGQDAHYWTFQYGPRSSLLGGAVIGSVNDISATYYNPGTLVLADDLAFAVSANVFDFSILALEDGGGNGIDLGTSQSGIRPSMIAGTIKKGLFGKGILAYSILTRAKGSQDLQGISFLTPEDLPADTKFKDLAGLSRFEGEFNDLWAGISYSQPIGSHIGLGVTWYGAARSQRRRRENIVQSVLIDQGGSAIIDIAGGNYSTYRTLLKFGISTSTGPFTAGLTFTTPSLHIGGKGDFGLNKSNISPDTAAISASIQTDLKAIYKSPLSIGAGFGLQIGRARLHGSAEWFDEVSPYFVMQGEDFFSQEPEGNLVKMDVVQAIDAVFNWAIGLEYSFSPTVNGYLSFFQDNSGLTENIERAGLSTLPIDIKNINLGADFTVGPILLTLGGGYGWGNKVDQILTDILQQEDPDFEATFVLSNIRLLFGFELTLNKEDTD